MSDRLTALFEKFVSEARSILIEEAQAALGQIGGGVRPVSRISTARETPRAKAQPKVAGKRAKRTAEDIEKQANLILNYLKKHPGEGAEQIGAGLGMTTLELALPVKFLLAKKSLKTVGQKRGTKYTAK